LRLELRFIESHVKESSMRSITAISALAVLGGIAPAAFAQFGIPWHTIDGGGGTSSGGTFVIRGTIGQHDAGKSAGGNFVISGGFWSQGLGAACAADLDNGSGTGTPDNAVTIDDLLYFLVAFEDGTIEADLDDDGVNPPNPDGGVTIDDLLFFLLRFEAGC
jgi:hypothetical protein